METPSQRCGRLAGAFEQLVTMEATLVEAGDFAAVAEVQVRAAPIVSDLATLAAEADEPTRARVLRVLERRKRTETFLGQEIERTAAALRQNAAANVRVALLRPVYAGHGESEVHWRRTA